QRGHDLSLGIELYAEAPRIVGGLRLSEPRNAARGRVAMRARFGHGLGQLVDDVLRRWHVRIAHAQIDDIGAAGACCRLEAVHLTEHVRWQSLDAMEFFDHVAFFSLACLLCPRQSALTARGCSGGGTAGAFSILFSAALWWVWAFSIIS